MTIQDYIKSKLESNDKAQNYHIGIELGVSSGTLSHYKTGYTKQPSLTVAQIIYELDQVVIYPFSLYAVSKGKEKCQ